MSKFKDKYRKQDCEQIQLEDATFHVLLPTSANRRYERAVAGAMSKLDTKTGEFVVADLDLVDIFDAQLQAFLRSCVVKVDGIDFDSSTFYSEYPDATEDLFQKAVELASRQEVEAKDSVGKSQATSPGPASGKGEKSSTQECLKAAG